MSQKNSPTAAEREFADVMKNHALKTIAEYAHKSDIINAYGSEIGRRLVDDRAKCILMGYVLGTQFLARSIAARSLKDPALSNTGSASTTVDAALGALLFSHEGWKEINLKEILESAKLH